MGIIVGCGVKHQVNCHDMKFMSQNEIPSALDNFMIYAWWHVIFGESWYSCRIHIDPSIPLIMDYVNFSRLIVEETDPVLSERTEGALILT